MQDRRNLARGNQRHVCMMLMSPSSHDARVPRLPTHRVCHDAHSGSVPISTGGTQVKFLVDAAEAWVVAAGNHRPARPRRLCAWNLAPSCWLLGSFHNHALHQRLLASPQPELPASFRLLLATPTMPLMLAQAWVTVRGRRARCRTQRRRIT